MMNLYPCLGFEFLGQCAYNPSKPDIVYFGLGESVAALIFALAIQQFLRPLYEFRLEVRNIRRGYLYTLVFLGFLFALVGALVSNISLDRSWPIAYPVVWEILGALLFAIAYALLAFGSILPLKLKNGQEELFARAAANFLAERDDKAQVELGWEILNNLPFLIESAAFVENRYRQWSAFAEFRYRKRIKQSSYASSLIQIISDKRFCKILVEKCPWLVARTINEISDRRLHTRSAERFVQEISTQALSSDYSSLARETGYSGFSNAPILSESLYGSIHVLQKFMPFYWLRLADIELSRGFLERLEKASERAVETTLSSGVYWEVTHLYHLKGLYESIFGELNRTEREDDRDFRKIMYAASAVKNIVEKVQSHLETVDKRERDLLYVEDGIDDISAQLDIVEVASDIVVECLFQIANRFKGPDDPFWNFAMAIRRELFMGIGSEPRGMNPLQQRVAIKLRSKIQDNMKGYYPAVTRVLLAVLGPYRIDDQPNRTSARIFNDMLYGELRGFRQLVQKKPEKLRDYLPDNVEYDVDTNTFRHNWFPDGHTDTNMSRIRPQQVLLDKASIAN